MHCLMKLKPHRNSLSVFSPRYIMHLSLAAPSKSAVRVPGTVPAPRLMGRVPRTSAHIRYVSGPRVPGGAPIGSHS